MEPSTTGHTTDDPPHSHTRTRFDGYITTIFFLFRYSVKPVIKMWKPVCAKNTKRKKCRECDRMMAMLPIHDNITTVPIHVLFVIISRV